MNKEQLIKVLEPHKDALSTVKKWDEYAEDHNLPPSVNLIYHFGSWNNVKRAFHLPIKKHSYSIHELEEIALQHKTKFIRKNIWDSYSKEHKLPASSTFIKAFGSWQNVKKHIGLEVEKRKKDLYTKEDIKKILIEHGKHYENRKQWDEYAKKHKLPTYKTLKKHFDYEEILSIVQKTPKTKEDYLKIAKEHKEIFLRSSMKQWDEYAKANNLPSSFIYYKAFGSWNKAKNELSLKM
jgi:hypothetical protein